MPARQPRPEQLEEFIEKKPEGSLYMLNLLKFRDRAIYEDGRETDLTGEEAYMIYGAAVQKIIEGFGGGLVFGAKTNTQLIGDGDLRWDWVGLMRYPSFESFSKMTRSADYAEIHVHRDAGLDHQILVNCLDVEETMSAFGKVDG
ncbi:MAG: DUF1330 domain-containing protein [bacterium]|nr:DUF1330 domain-containing protein [bacterium]